MSAIKVCMIIATLERGGAEHQLSLVATNLDRARFEPFVVALTRGGSFEQVLRDRDVPHAVIGKRAKLAPLALVRLARLVRSLRPDVVHTWMFTASAYGRVAARLAGVRAVVANVNCAHLGEARVRLGVDRMLARKTRRFIAVSESVAEWLEGAGVPGQRITTIHDAFEPAGWPCKPLGGPPEVGRAPRLVAVGRLWPQKRYDVVLRCMREIVRAFPEAHLTIAGEGPARPELEGLADELGLGQSVSMPGLVQDVPGLLARSDLFLMGSDYEGLPNAVMEAMYVGLPVVATDAPGIRDLVRDGCTGVLAPTGDPEALAARAVDLLGSPELMQAVAVQARRLIAEDHTVEGMVRAYEEVYERLAGGEGEFE